jgi:hypothetical protein
MAELDLAALAARHHRTDAPGAIDHGYCQCEDGLDCRVPELLAEVARLRDQNAEQAQRLLRMRAELAAEQERGAKQARNWDSLVAAKAHATQHAHELKAEVARLQAEVLDGEDMGECLSAEIVRLRAFVRAWCPDDWHGGARYRQEAAALGIVLA